MQFPIFVLLFYFRFSPVWFLDFRFSPVLIFDSHRLVLDFGFWILDFHSLSVSVVELYIGAVLTSYNCACATLLKICGPRVGKWT